ncbi:unnamed protein product [Brassicogethes aeneus]|uniref:Uncharacterized protein n=1 Tax=Brassicogethes aeneus TaxID=1431903 RepID=A0A9P0B477_BRAAE|nr:unnamed protein product [Brassicogethes aeneus]
MPSYRIFPLFVEIVLFITFVFGMPRKCNIYCKDVECHINLCEAGDQLVKPTCGCCEICMKNTTNPDCRLALCATVACGEGYKAVKKGCCDICVKIGCLSTKIFSYSPKCNINCAAVQCLKPNCTEGQKLITSPCQCCPQCVDIEDCGCTPRYCSMVRCNTALNCTNGEVGGHCKCCNICKPNCVGRLCPQILCISGSRSVQYGCCNTCIKIASPSEKCTCLREIEIGLVSAKDARVCPSNKNCIREKCLLP